MIFLPFPWVNRLSFRSTIQPLTNFRCFFNFSMFFLRSHFFISDSLLYSLPLRRIHIQLSEPNQRWKPAYALHQRSVVLYIGWLVISASTMVAHKPSMSSMATSLSAVGTSSNCGIGSRDFYPSEG